MIIIIIIFLLLGEREGEGGGCESAFPVNRCFASLGGYLLFDVPKRHKAESPAIVRQDFPPDRALNRFPQKEIVAGKRLEDQRIGETNRHTYK